MTIKTFEDLQKEVSKLYEDCEVKTYSEVLGLGIGNGYLNTKKYLSFGDFFCIEYKDFRLGIKDCAFPYSPTIKYSKDPQKIYNIIKALKLAEE